MAKVNFSDWNKNYLQQSSYKANSWKIENAFGTTFAGESLWGSPLFTLWKETE